MVQSEALRQILDFDVDRYLNPWIPHNRLYILPKSIRHWLGYRESPQKEPYNVLQWPITFLATVAGLCLVAGIGNYAPGITAWHPPVLIASLGASAVLDFNTIKSPLAQPRNAVIGNTLAAICGTAIAKLFQLNSDFDNIQWVSGAVGCALASWVMSLTNTIHPPGGATAVLASTETMIIAMGWKFVPIVLLDSCLMVVVACIFNNILRQYPIYWWTPANTGRKLRNEKLKAQQEQEAKAAEEGKASAKATSDTSSDRTLQRELSNRVDFVDGIEDVHIRAYRIELPHHLKLEDEEVMLLEKIQERLRTHGEIENP
ncbi:Transmembrane protein [Pseudocercospora fuligena]|uniref:Transmembrane protein n=1 Tax=Pseudocercospora fuligena TaxID=685502 RepID=A0A8H6RKM3_9PEZI|nr:Transmembrane protein [Pseudocercospora fuligena]